MKSKTRARSDTRKRRRIAPKRQSFLDALRVRGLWPGTAARNRRKPHKPRRRATPVPASESAIVQTQTTAGETALDSSSESRPSTDQCDELARDTHILDRVTEEVRRTGVVGEERTVKVLYLALTSRLFDRPVSVAVKGPSSGGKSFLVSQVLALFPPEAFYELSAMSDRALVYSTEPLKHRFLVIYEAAGMSGDFASYSIRSLLSEGRLRYETVERTQHGLQPRLIQRDGPTGLLLTTTSVRLHPENETRILSLPVTDTSEQTARVLLAVARNQSHKIDAPAAWHALQRRIARGQREVVIPFAEELAKAITPVGLRLRRDFTALLNLVKAHALLHQATRSRDEHGRVVATLEDYGIVRELIVDLMAEGLGATVSPTIRQTVRAVEEELGAAGAGHVTVSAVARRLNLDTSAALRRVKVAISGGFVRNLEDRARLPARLELGDPLPDEVDLLPPPEGLQVGSRVAGDSLTIQASDVNGGEPQVPLSTLAQSGLPNGDGDGSVQAPEVDGADLP
jgi:hypothetical protein